MSIPTIAATLVRNPHATIVSIVAELVRGGVLREQCTTTRPMAVAAAHIVFAVIGWITFLYNPQLDYVSPSLSIVWEDNSMFENFQQGLHHAARQSLVLSLRRFGNLIPGNWNRTSLTPYTIGIRTRRLLSRGTFQRDLHQPPPHLLFCEDHGARQLYKKQRKIIRATTGGHIDPYLDMACSFMRDQESLLAARVEQTFRKSAQFLLFADRLTELQRFEAAERGGVLEVDGGNSKSISLKGQRKVTSTMRP